MKGSSSMFSNYGSSRSVDGEETDPVRFETLQDILLFVQCSKCVETIVIYHVI